MKKELLIFGANGALGKGISKVLADKDYDKIYLYDFNITDLDVQNNHTEKIEIKDLSIEENVKKCFEKIQPSKEKLFFLYSTVGGFTGGKTIWESGAEDLNKMINMNLKPGYFIAKYFAKLVKDSAGGSICLTAAYTGIVPEEKKSEYGLTKAALIHLIETLALEGREVNLTANAIAPYIIDTPANRKWDKDADYENWLKPDEIGNIVNSIFSNFHFISGNVIRLPYRINLNVF